MTEQGIYYLATAFSVVGIAWAIAFIIYIIQKNQKK
jgi:hypothetical protein